MGSDQGYPRFTIRKLGCSAALLASLLLAAIRPANSQGKKFETIDAHAMGTGTQVGGRVHIRVVIYQFSTEEDRAVLVDAYKQGQHKGLVDALSKMKPVGRIAITGTTGSDLAYIRLIRTDTGRKIIFATNRRIRFGEIYGSANIAAYDLTTGKLDLNDTEKKKSTGILYPAAQLVINEEGQLEFQLNENPWKLVSILDRNPISVGQ
jgi:uncharacterized protein (DUF2252 family)